MEQFSPFVALEQSLRKRDNVVSETASLTLVADVVIVTVLGEAIADESLQGSHHALHHEVLSSFLAVGHGEKRLLQFT